MTKTKIAEMIESICDSMYEAYVKAANDESGDSDGPYNATREFLRKCIIEQIGDGSITRAMMAEIVDRTRYRYIDAYDDNVDLERYTQTRYDYDCAVRRIISTIHNWDSESTNG